MLLYSVYSVYTRWTRGAASMHTTVLISHTGPSYRSPVAATHFPFRWR